MSADRLCTVWLQTCSCAWLSLSVTLFLHSMISLAGLTLTIASIPPGHCLGAPWNAPVEIYNFLIGCPLPRRKCLSKTKQTGLRWTGIGLHPHLILLWFEESSLIMIKSYFAFVLPPFPSSSCSFSLSPKGNVPVGRYVWARQKQKRGGCVQYWCVVSGEKVVVLFCCCYCCLCTQIIQCFC